MSESIQTSIIPYDIHVYSKENMHTLLIKYFKDTVSEDECDDEEWIITQTTCKITLPKHARQCVGCVSKTCSCLFAGTVYSIPNLYIHGLVSITLIEGFILVSRDTSIKQKDMSNPNNPIINTIYVDYKYFMDICNQPIIDTFPLLDPDYESKTIFIILEGFLQSKQIPYTKITNKTDNTTVLKIESSKYRNINIKYSELKEQNLFTYTKIFDTEKLHLVMGSHTNTFIKEFNEYLDNLELDEDGIEDIDIYGEFVVEIKTK